MNLRPTTLHPSGDQLGHAGDGGGGLPQGPGRVLNIQGTAKQAVPFCVVLPALLAHGSCQTLSCFCSISA